VYKGISRRIEYWIGFVLSALVSSMPPLECVKQKGKYPFLRSGRNFLLPEMRRNTTDTPFTSSQN